MLTYLRREGRKPSGWSRLTSRFKPDSAFVEDKELPQDIAERRLNRRVYSYWELKHGAAGLPAPSDIKPEELSEDWPFCFILDIGAGFGFPKFDFLGAEIAKYSGVFLSGRRDWTSTVLDKATGQVSKVVASGGPVFCDDELTLFNGRRLLFRSVLLPLSADGMTITHLLGAANGKFAAQN